MTLVGIGQVGIAHRWATKASPDESHGYHKRERKKKQKRKRKCTTTTMFYTRKRTPCTPSPRGYSTDPGGSRLLADVGPISAPITSRTRSGGRVKPGSTASASSSRIPKWIVLRLRPVATATDVTPPQPSDKASVAAHRRRIRSVIAGQRESYVCRIHSTTDASCIHIPSEGRTQNAYFIYARSLRYVARPLTRP